MSAKISNEYIRLFCILERCARLNIHTPPILIEINYLTGEMYDDRPKSYTADGTKKVEPKILDRVFTFALFDVFFVSEYNGEKENSQIHLFDPRIDEDKLHFFKETIYI